MPPQDIESVRNALYLIVGPSLIGLVLWFLKKMSATLDKVAETCERLKHENIGMQKDLGRLQAHSERLTEDHSELRERVVRLEATK